MKKPISTMASSVFAGFMIGVGGIAFLKCDIAYIGALLFCVGLATICTFGLCLFTGRVGYVIENKNPLDMAVIWIGNVIGAYLCAVLITPAAPELGVKAAASVAARLGQSAYKTLALAFFCGIMMFAAVDVYKKKDGFAAYIGILLCIPTFILCGFEHSVADMFYFAAAGELWNNLPHILLVSLGNAIGSVAAWELKKLSDADK